MAEELEKAQAGDRIQLFTSHFISIEPLLYTRVCVRHGGECKEEKDKPPASESGWWWGGLWVNNRCKCLWWELSGTMCGRHEMRWLTPSGKGGKGLSQDSTFCLELEATELTWWRIGGRSFQDPGAPGWVARKPMFWSLLKNREEETQVILQRAKVAILVFCATTRTDYSKIKNKK